MKLPRQQRMKPGKRGYPTYLGTIWMPATGANRSINLKFILTQVQWIKAFILAGTSSYSSTYRFEQM